MIQDRIDKVVTLVEDALGRCGSMTPEDRDHVLDGVKELGFRWQEAIAHARAATVALGLTAGYYPGHLKEQFVRECLALKQFDELRKKESTGSAYLFKQVPMTVYAELVDLLMVQQIEGHAGEYAENEQEEPDDADRNRVTVEIVDRVPDTYTGQDSSHGTLKKAETVTSGKTGRKNGPGVKTAERIRKATNAPVKKATGRKKTGGAADGK
jgi:hypothetical protein